MARIMVVEDAPELRDLLALILQDEGHQVASFRTPRDARAALGVEQFDLVLSDLSEDRAEGPGEEDRAWLAEAARHARVLVLTGRSWASKLTAEQLGVDGLVQKPFEIDQLLEYVSSLIPSND